MKTFAVTLGYLKWHYSRALKSISLIWKDFFIFLFNFFSIKSVVRNFFDPWKRMSDPYPHTFNFKDFLFAVIGNTITRIIGIIMRLLVLVIGLIVLALFCLVLPLALIIWILLPFILLFCLGQSLFLIFK